ncbi:hypothetical protein HNQ91_002627 [Filimonas zeae]|uniref:DUF4394 domain-containing protein n=1 Tax=Filimonas zeae TaxID=1737353 RepID=A0A917ITD4_9BACT|nr:DUF4394 domain-containing protein [Filimonas zeae]MDR6339576.1 hypothetical protein [Filimonas zeae]GGH62969.1 hypothetical protein GCM10011379_13350 [Filimonas zeae]
MKRYHNRPILVLLMITVAFLSSCKKNDDDTMDMGADFFFWGLTASNQLIKYNVKATQTPVETVNVTGLAAGEKLLSIDFRPATGQLYALSSNSRLYTIHLGTNKGSATVVGTAAFSPAISGTIASIDFNPTVDRIRLVTNSGQNLRLHPETGALAASDIAINGAAGAAVTGIAYTNSVAGATATTLFDIDVANRKLYKQIPPNDGKLVEVGTINADFTGQAGFDINADNSRILATFTASGTTRLYTLDTANAATRLAGTLSAAVIDIAIPSDAVAYAAGNGQLQIFNPLAKTAITTKTVGGLGTGEVIAGIDFRPANGQLYGITLTPAGNFARLYTFNLGTGLATAVGSGFALTAGTTALGFDFNPTVDKIRLVTDLGQNLRLSPVDGTISNTDLTLNPATLLISGAAYTNSFAGAASTTLFVLNSTRLYKQDPPNNGVLTETGSLGVTAESTNGFDIGGTTNQGYALLTVAGATRLYTINTTTGMAAAGRDYPNKVTGFAVGGGF